MSALIDIRLIGPQRDPRVYQQAFATLALLRQMGVPCRLVPTDSSGDRQNQIAAIELKPSLARVMNNEQAPSKLQS